MTLSDILFAVRQTQLENGDITWVSVDLDTFTEDGEFQVFNTFTGRYEGFEHLAPAKAKWDQLKYQIEQQSAVSAAPGYTIVRI